MKILVRFFSIILLGLAAILGLALFIISLQYAVSPVYTFPEIKKFSGPVLFNPYDGLSDTWYKANFHAHSRAYGGLTDGRRNSPDEIHRFYSEHGYGVISLSNYHSVYRTEHNDERFFPAYEHGYNVFKTHQIVLNPTEITWYDIPLPQTTHNKQFVLKKLRKVAPLTILAHPKFVRGYSPEELQKLSDYDCIEVLNHYRISDMHWDAALSAGKAVWIIGDDDTHDASNPGETGVCWTMLNARSSSVDDVISAIRAGRTFGVRGNNAEMDNFPKEISVRGNLLYVGMDSTAGEIRFIGQDGKIMKTVRDSVAAAYEFRPGDSYIRTEIISPKTHIYLNPVFRTTTGKVPVQALAEPDFLKTWLYRLPFLLAYGAGVYFVVRKFRRKRALS